MIRATQPQEQHIYMTAGLLRAEIADVSDVDAGTLARAWEVFDGCYARADRQRFERDFREKDVVILLREDDGNIQGFSTLELRGWRRALVAFSGDTVITPRFWGQPTLPRAFTRVLAEHKIADPERPLYWFLISKGFRTYRMFARAFERSVPTHRNGHSDLMPLLHDLARDRFGDQFDPRTGIVRYREPHEYVRHSIASVPLARQDDTDVLFFERCNPGHTRGDELACLAEVRLDDPVMRLACRSLVRETPASA